MYQFLPNTLISFTLTMVVALTGVIPTVGCCTEKGNQSGLISCCCPESDDAVQSCCSELKLVLTCRCSAGNERPGVPIEKHTSNERSACPRTDCVSVAFDFYSQGAQRQFLKDATLFSFQPLSRYQAILCCWLI